jgi:hypothetical protein
VLTAAVGTKGLQSIAWRYLQAIQRRRRVELQQFSAGHSLYAAEAANCAALKQRLGVTAGKRPDHATLYSV